MEDENLIGHKGEPEKTTWSKNQLLSCPTVAPGVKLNLLIEICIAAHDMVKHEKLHFMCYMFFNGWVIGMQFVNKDIATSKLYCTVSFDTDSLNTMKLAKVFEIYWRYCGLFRPFHSVTTTWSHIRWMSCFSRSTNYSSFMTCNLHYYIAMHEAWTKWPSFLDYVFKYNFNGNYS